MEYIVHVYNTNVGRIVEEKRFTVEAVMPQTIVNELAAKIESYFGTGYELARLEKVDVVEDVCGIKFGNNFNVLT